MNGGMKGLAIGQKAVATRVFTKDDVASYRSLTADTGLAFGQIETGEERPAVPGPLLAGLFSFLLGTRLPGRGTNWLKQRLTFSATAHLNEEITAEVEIIRLRREKALVNLRTRCTNPAGVLLCEGEALVLVSELELGGQTVREAPMG